MEIIWILLIYIIGISISWAIFDMFSKDIMSSDNLLMAMIWPIILIAIPFGIVVYSIYMLTKKLITFINHYQNVKKSKSSKI